MRDAESMIPQASIRERAYLTVSEAAFYLRMSESWLNKRRMHKGGPPFARVGTRILYHRETLDLWVKERGRDT